MTRSWVEWRVEGALSAFEDHNFEVKRLSLAELIEAKSVRRVELERVGELLRSEEDSVVATAASALRMIGAPSREYVPELLDLLKDENEWIRFTSAKALVAIGMDADLVPTITKLLKDEDLTVRLITLNVLGELGEHSSGYVSEIVLMLKDDDRAVRESALNVLGELGEHSSDYVSEIALMLKDDDRAVRRTALNVLGGLGEHSSGYVSEIVLMLKDEDGAVRRTALNVLGGLGEYSSGYVSEIVLMLKDEDGEVRWTAETALIELGEHSSGYVSEIALMLKDEDGEVRQSALYVLGGLGEHSSGYVSEIAMMLKDEDGEVRQSALYVLGELGEHSSDYVAEIELMLKDEDWKVRLGALYVLGGLGEHSSGYVSEIVLMLKDKDWEVREAALSVLGELGEHSSGYVSEIVLMLKDDDGLVRMAAETALIGLGEHSSDYVSEIVLMLKDEDWNVRRAALNVLGRLGEYSSGYVSEIVLMLKDKDWEVREAAETALIGLGEHSSGYVSEIALMLKDEEGAVRETALNVLGGLGEHSSDYVAEIALMLKDEDWKVRESAYSNLQKIISTQEENIPPLVHLLDGIPDGVRKLIVTRDLLERGPKRFEDLCLILEQIHMFGSEKPRLRFIAHVLGAGDPEMKLAMSWLGRPDSLPVPVEDPSLTLETLNRLYEAAEDFENLEIETSTAIAVVTTLGHENGHWSGRSVDLGQLRRSAELLQGSVHSGPIENVIKDLEDSEEIRKWVRRGFFVLVCHIVVWSLLLFVYPRSRVVQEVFFWNPWFRKWLSLFYVSLVLALFTRLRKRMLLPMAESLIADASLDEFDVSHYFEQDRLKRISGASVGVTDGADRRIQGQIILEGDSGLGKTMFARWLLLNTKGPKAYLPARDCKDGVLDALQRRLIGQMKDLSFLEAMVFNGGLAICIDGLNETSADVRARIKSDLQPFRRANVLLVTQPLNWDPPKRASRWQIQPLDDEGIEEFLMTRLVTTEREEFRRRCRLFLDSVLGDEEGFSGSYRRVLSNPMDLTVVADLIDRGEKPDLSALEEQQYNQMEREYERVNAGQSFPLKPFSERVYEMRLNDEKRISDFEEELKVMERFKMVLCRVTSDGEQWMFRHDKIVDSFVVQAFKNSSERVEQHFDDPRFRGVYFMLAESLPFSDAKELSEKISDHAASTSDHTVSDEIRKIILDRSEA
ncbi:MAG: HEAT repeat domain-containing protein [Verrucomicrobiota bacterium]